MTAQFTMPIEDRYFEDYIAGNVHEFGRIMVEEHDVVEFARRYDPQPFHMDPDAAQHTPFGGLIASGWHTAGLMMRLVVDHYLSHVASLASTSCAGRSRSGPAIRCRSAPRCSRRVARARSPIEESSLRCSKC